MPADFARLESKLDKTLEHLARVDITLVQQNATLEEHVRRSETNEAALALLREEFEPIKRAHLMWAGVGKALAVIGTAIGIAAGILKVLHP